MSARVVLAVVWLALAVGWVVAAGMFSTPWVVVPCALTGGGCLGVGLVLLCFGWPQEWSA